MTNLNPLTVLMTSVGNDGFPSVLAAVKSNGERDVRVIGVDVRSDAPGLYLADQGHKVPARREAEALLKRLLEICYTEQVRVLYPLSTEDQEFFASNTRQFEERGIAVVVAPLPALQIANDKLQLNRFAEANGISCPKYKAVTNWEELTQAARELGFPGTPFVIKLNRGTGGQGVKVVYDSLDPLERMFDRDNRAVAYHEVEHWLKGEDVWPALHVCEYLPGNEYSVDVLSNKGNIISAVTRLRLSAHYGLALHARVVDAPDVQDLACAVTSKLGLRFVINVQVRRAADGTPKLMEINPRIPGTIGLTVHAGINMPYYALKMALNEPFAVGQPRFGMTIMRHWDAVYILSE